jgi:uncharacterized protein YndB with AHSA1/START domain
MNDGALDLEISRFLSVSRARLWRAWTDPVLLAQWWCPKPWTTEVLAFDPRPGGGFHTLMRGPAETGGESDNPGCFLEVVPERRIAFTSSLGPGWRPARPWLAMTAIIDMADEADGTRYTARVLHESAADAARHDEMGFRDGWGTVIGQLEALAKTL